jgi:hypothetical protein
MFSQKVETTDKRRLNDLWRGADKNLINNRAKTETINEIIVFKFAA